MTKFLASMKTNHNQKKDDTMKIMHKILFTVLAAALGGWSSGFGDKPVKGHHGAGTAVSDTIIGEVVDITCFLGHGDRGKDHEKCARQCVQKGLPVGLLTEKGDVYLAVGPDHQKANDMLLDHVAKTVKVVGKKTESAAMKMFEVRLVMKADSAKSSHAIPAIKPASASGVYACPMHSDVKQSGPGICPKCGMALEKPGKP